MLASHSGLLLVILMIVVIYRSYRSSTFLNLKCVIADANGKRYCVRDRSRVDEAANLLAKTGDTLQTIVDSSYEKYPGRSNCIRLKRNFNPKAIEETLPTSELTAYSENKGERLAFCLSKRSKTSEQLIDGNTLLFVAIHELAHIATVSVGHTEEFWDNFRFLLHHAESIGVYSPIDYSADPRSYCGMQITDNPYYS